MPKLCRSLVAGSTMDQNKKLINLEIKQSNSWLPMSFFALFFKHALPNRLPLFKRARYYIRIVESLYASGKYCLHRQ